MAFKSFNLKTGILIVAFAVIVLLMLFTLDIGEGTSPITGFIVYGCSYDVGGVVCDDAFIPLNLDKDCPENTVSICTNICEIDRTIQEDARICPAYCREYCVSPKLAQKLNINRGAYF